MAQRTGGAGAREGAGVGEAAVGALRLLDAAGARDGVGVDEAAVGALRLLDAAGARAGDQAAVDAGETWAGLMDRAAGHLARGVVATAGHGYGLRVAILAGKGNNGGDGWVAANRLADEHGAQAWVVAVDGTDVEVSDETRAGRTRWLQRGGRTSSGTDHLDEVLAWCDIAVDALLGTGVSGAPRGASGDAATALLRAREAGTTVIACDIPSGVSADDGSAPEGAVRADVTITFGGLKRGLLLHPGAAHAGRVIVGDLGERYDPGPSRWSVLTPAGAAPAPLDVAADKRERGVVLAVAGAAGTSGAATLTAGGALRAGAGLVTVGTPEAVRGEIASRSDAGIMVRGLPADDVGAVDDDAVHALPDLDGFDAVVAGPGLGHGRGAATVVAHLRRRALRLVLDADALNVHRDDPGALADHAGALVLTPHERELARIGGGSDGPEAWANRAERVPELARSLDATIVAKGPGTLVAAPDGRIWVAPMGGPALGSGGTGDLLAGIIGAAIARADDVPLAVAQAVWWHAAAGEIAGRRSAGRASATDLFGVLPEVLVALDRMRTGAGSAAAGARPGTLPWDHWRRGWA